jgi:Na+(H+)/acetate symporter ActP
MNRRKFRWKFRIPKRFAPFLFPFLLSGLMTLLITGMSIARVLGMDTLVNNPGSFVQTWLKAYVSAWLVAYPILLLVIPIVRRLVDWLTADE